MKCSLFPVMLLGFAGGLMLPDRPANAQQGRPTAPQAKPRPAEPQLQMHVYRVADLLVPRPDYPYRGAALPTTQPAMPGGIGGGGFGGGLGAGMGGIGGGGMGGGGGFFAVPDPAQQTSGVLAAGLGQFTGSDSGMYGGMGMSGMGDLGGGIGMASSSGLRFSMQELVSAIETTVDPVSWAAEGGAGAITPLGGMLIIRQSPENHALIEALLQLIRQEGGTQQTVTIRAYWMPLSGDQLDQLVPGGDERSGAPLVDADALKVLAAEQSSYRGQITCFSDQTVHIVSGQRRTVVNGGVPSVGMYSVGYTPSVIYPNIGVLLEVTPSLLPEGEAVVLNLTSTVTDWRESGESVRMHSVIPPARVRATDPSGQPGGGPAPELEAAGHDTQVVIDRVNLGTQHLGTTVRVPLGRPVLVGGMSRAGGEREDGAASAPPLHLVVEVHVNDSGHAKPTRR